MRKRSPTPKAKSQFLQTTMRRRWKFWILGVPNVSMVLNFCSEFVITGIIFLPSESEDIEGIAKKEDPTEGDTSADPEVKFDKPYSPDHDAATSTSSIANDLLAVAVVNDGTTSSADVIVESDGATRKTSSILLQGTIFLKLTRFGMDGDGIEEGLTSFTRSLH